MNNKRNIKGGIALFIGITSFEVLNNRDSLFLLWHLNVVTFLSYDWHVATNISFHFFICALSDGLQEKVWKPPWGNGERRESYLSSSIQICPPSAFGSQIVWFALRSWTTERMRSIFRQWRRIGSVGVGGPHYNLVRKERKKKQSTFN